MKEVRKEYCFTNSSGEDIYLFTLSNANGYSVGITNYGAIITSFMIAQDGILNDIVLGFKNTKDYFLPEYLAGYPYFGAAIGRYANRIKNGEFSIDDTQYSVTKNKGNDHLHGGANGFDRKVWSFVSLDTDPNPNLVLQYHSPDGEEGYPGDLTVKLRFELNNKNELSYEFMAQCDKPTAVNLTHHSYFNLDIKKKTIDQHFARISSSNILEQDDNFVVTGKLLPVTCTPYDFSSFKQINEDWNSEDGYDQSFVVDLPGDFLPVAEAYSQQSGIALQVFSSEPLVHFYTGKWIPRVDGKDSYGPFSGFCFETQKHPNAVNIPHFPNTVLRPGETYYSKTTYRVTKI